MSEWHPVAKEIYDPLKAGSIDGTDQEPHDHGIIRALRAKYRCNKRVIGDPLRTLFVARLHPKTTEETLFKVFSQYGRISHCRLVVDLVTAVSKRYAFIEYESIKYCDRAYIKANKIDIDGCEIFVDYECERMMEGWVPRRLGGGLGGKKESGQLRFGGRDRRFRKPIIVATGTEQRMAIDRQPFSTGKYRHHQSRHHY